MVIKVKIIETVFIFTVLSSSSLLRRCCLKIPAVEASFEHVVTSEVVLVMVDPAAVAAVVVGTALAAVEVA